jgi:predicted Zn-dependent protease
VVKKLYLLACASLVLLSACAKESAADKAASALANARKLSEAGQFQSARAELEVAIKAAPSAADAHLLLAQIAEKQGDLQTALGEYVTADATAAGASDARHALAGLLLRTRAYKLAEEWIARCIADRPADKAMKAYRALLAERLGDSKRARADAEAVLTEDQTNAVANQVLAEEALRRKDFAQALTKIQAGLSKDDSDRPLLQLRADAFRQQQLPEKAIEEYQKLVALDPASPEYRLNLAELIATRNGTDAGEQVLRDGIKAAPDSVDMHLRLISFLAQHKPRSTIVDELKASIGAAPNQTTFDVVLAQLYAQDNELDAAAKTLNDAVMRTNQEPAHAFAQLALSRLMMARNETSAARAIVENVIKTNPNNDDAIAMRGELSLREQNPNAALRDFLAVAGRQPANVRVYPLLADAYLQNDQPSEAVAALKRASSLDPANSELLRRIVQVHSGLGDFAAASRAIEDFLARNPDSVEGRTLQIELAIRGKDWTSAETGLSRLREAPQADRLNVQLQAEIREGQNQNDEAAKLYGRLVLREKDKLDVSAAQAFARASIAAGQIPQAINLLTQHVSDVPQADLAVYELVLAMLYGGAGETGKAGGLVESAIARSPAAPAAYLQQSQMLVRRKEFAEALAILDRGLAAGAPKGPLLLFRAQIQGASGKRRDAIATYRELLRLDPGSAIAANELTNALADQTPLDQAALRDARDTLQKSVSFKTMAMIDSLAWADYRLGEFEKAKDLLMKIRADQSPNPQLRFHYGAVLVALGEPAKGQGVIRTTLNDNYPGRDEAERMMGKP